MENNRVLALPISTFAKNCSNSAHRSNKVSQNNAVCSNFCGNLIGNRSTGGDGYYAVDAQQLNGVD